ncbi:MAG: PQQ-binding-like beta-propeller repeat protein [Chthoniobacterales bacterium]
MNAYGSVVGFLVRKGKGFVVPETNITFVLGDGILTGTLSLSDVTFILKRVRDNLPLEPTPPRAPLGPKDIWSYRTNSSFWASPTISEGVVYIGDAAGNLHAVKVADGKPKWIFNAHTPLFGSATVVRDAVYIFADSGYLFKLQRDSGTEIWKVYLGGDGVSRTLPGLDAAQWDSAAPTPAVAEGMVYLGSADGVFHAIDATSGKTIWVFRAGGKIRSSALLTPDRVYFGSFDQFVYALDRKSGALHWKFDTGSAVTTTPVFVRDKILVGIRDRSTLFALNVEDGKPIWNVFFWLSWVESTPCMADGIVYVGSSDSHRIRAIDPSSGSVIWASQVWGSTWGTPLVVNDTIYYGTAGSSKYFIHQEPSLGALDRKSGAMKWRQALPLGNDRWLSGYTGSLVYGEGKIIAAGLDGNLVAFPP